MGTLESLQGLLPSMPQNARRQPRFQQQPSPLPQMQHQHQRQPSTSFFNYSGEVPASFSPHETLLTRPSAHRRAQHQPPHLLAIVPSHEAFEEARRVVQAERAAYEQRALQNLHSASFQPAQSTSKSLFTVAMLNSLTVSSDVGLQPYPHIPSPANTPVALSSEALAGNTENSFQDGIEAVAVDPAMENDFDRQFAQGDFSDSEVYVVDHSFDEASPSSEQVEIPVPVQQEMRPQPEDPATLTPPQEADHAESLDVDRIVQEGFAQLAEPWDGMEADTALFKDSPIEHHDQYFDQWSHKEVPAQPVEPMHQSQETQPEHSPSPQQALNPFDPDDNNPLDFDELDAGQNTAAELFVFQDQLAHEFGSRQQGAPAHTPAHAHAHAPARVMNFTAVPAAAVIPPATVTGQVPATIAATTATAPVAPAAVQQPQQPQAQPAHVQQAPAWVNAPHDVRNAWRGREVRDHQGRLLAQPLPSEGTKGSLHCLWITHPQIPAQWQIDGIALADITLLLHYYLSIVHMYGRQTLHEVLQLSGQVPYHELDHRVKFAHLHGIPHHGWLPDGFVYRHTFQGPVVQGRFVNQSDFQMIGFPYINEPLPVGTTCAEMLAHYPNHVNHDYLDGFCQNDVKPSTIFRGVSLNVITAWRGAGVFFRQSNAVTVEDNPLSKRMQQSRYEILRLLGEPVVPGADKTRSKACLTLFHRQAIRIRENGNFLTLRPSARKGVSVQDYSQQQAAASVQNVPPPVQQAPLPAQAHYAAPPMQTAPAPAQYLYGTAPGQYSQMQYAAPHMQHTIPPVYHAPIHNSVQQAVHTGQNQGVFHGSAADTPIDLTFDGDTPSDRSVLTPGILATMDWGTLFDASFDTDNDVQRQPHLPEASPYQEPQAPTHHTRPQIGKRRRGVEAEQGSLVFDLSGMDEPYVKKAKKAEGPREAPSSAITMNAPVTQTSQKRRLDMDAFEVASEELIRPKKKPTSIAAQLGKHLFNETQQAPPQEHVVSPLPEIEEHEIAPLAEDIDHFGEPAYDALEFDQEIFTMSDAEFESLMATQLPQDQLNLFEWQPQQETPADEDQEPFQMFGDGMFFEEAGNDILE